MPASNNSLDEQWWSSMSGDGFPLDRLAALIFMMMGPVGLIPRFSSATAAADTVLRRKIAFKAFFFASVAVALAVAIGAGMLARWGVSPPSLIVAAGLLLTLASLQTILAPADAGKHQPAAPPQPPPQPPPLSIALSPIAFPSIVTPYGVGVLIVFVAYAPVPSLKLSILGIVLLIMLIDLLTMLFADRLLRWTGTAPLTILGAVFGVLQVALGIEMIASGINRMAAAS